MKQKVVKMRFFSKILHFDEICHKRGATARHRSATAAPPHSPPHATAAPPQRHRSATAPGAPQAHTFARMDAKTNFLMFFCVFTCFFNIFSSFHRNVMFFVFSYDFYLNRINPDVLSTFSMISKKTRQTLDSNMLGYCKAT